jgi:hypothetical protein
VARAGHRGVDGRHPRADEITRPARMSDGTATATMIVTHAATVATAPAALILGMLPSTPRGNQKLNNRTVIATGMPKTIVMIVIVAIMVPMAMTARVCDATSPFWRI